jgi:general stress protein CsbA
MADVDLDLTLQNVTLDAAAEMDLSGLFQILEDVSLDATIYKEYTGTEVVVTLDDVTIDATFYKELQLVLVRPLARVTVTSEVVLGVAPPLPPSSRIYNLTGEIRDNGGAILCFVGLPDRSVEWRIVEGLGTITPFTTYTDTLGRSSARFDAAGFSGRVVVGVAYVP